MRLGLFCVIGTGASACGDHVCCSMLVVIVWNASGLVSDDASDKVEFLLMFVNSGKRVRGTNERLPNSEHFWWAVLKPAERTASGSSNRSLLGASKRTLPGLVFRGSVLWSAGAVLPTWNGCHGPSSRSATKLAQSAPTGSHRCTHENTDR